MIFLNEDDEIEKEKDKIHILEKEYVPPEEKERRKQLLMKEVIRRTKEELKAKMAGKIFAHKTEAPTKKVTYKSLTHLTQHFNLLNFENISEEVTKKIDPIDIALSNAIEVFEFKIEHGQPTMFW